MDLKFNSEGNKLIMDCRVNYENEFYEWTFEVEYTRQQCMDELFLLVKNLKGDYATWYNREEPLLTYTNDNIIFYTPYDKIIIVSFEDKDFLFDNFKDESLKIMKHIGHDGLESVTLQNKIYYYDPNTMTRRDAILNALDDSPVI